MMFDSILLSEPFYRLGMWLVLLLAGLLIFVSGSVISHAGADLLILNSFIATSYGKEKIWYTSNERKEYCE